MDQTCLYYNIGSTLKYINPSLYNNCEPHKTVPDTYWGSVKEVLNEMKGKNIKVDWNGIKYRELYNAFKKKVTSTDESKPWRDIQLNNEYKFLFTNKEKEASYLIAQNVIVCGQQVRRFQSFTDVCAWNLNNCKFCKNLIDNAHHIFSGECMLVNKLYQVCKSMYWVKTKKRLCFDKKLIFYNQVDDIQQDFLKVKLMVIIKKLVLIEKGKLDKYKTFVNDQSVFIDNIMLDISRLFNFSLQNSSVYVSLGEASFWMSTSG